MSLSALVSTLAGSSIASPIEAVGNIIDKLFTSDDEKADKAILMQRLLQEPALAQVELNKLEAQHRSIFVAGWRPAIGWVCASALAWKFVGFDLVTWLCTVFDAGVTPPQFVGTDVLMELVVSLLGLAGLRTFEKTTGKAK